MKKMMIPLLLVFVLILSGCAAEDAGVKTIKGFCESVYNMDSDVMKYVRYPGLIATTSKDIYMAEFGKYDEAITNAGKDYCVSEDYATQFVAMWLPGWATQDTESILITKEDIKRIEDISPSEHTYSINLELERKKTDGSTEKFTKDGRAGLDENNKIIYVRGLEDDGY